MSKSNYKTGMPIKRLVKRTSLLVAAVLSLMLSCPSNVSALSIRTTDDDAINFNSLTPSQIGIYSSYEYVVDKYNVDIVVNQNNSFDITETITAYFNVAKHGIYRTIPLKNTITRLDGTTSTNQARVSKVSVDNEFTTSGEGDYYKIKIGSASKTLTGSQTYTIKYTYDIGKDPVEDYDELYFNIIGNEWDTAIGNVTFSITMPQEFDSSKLGFSAGAKASTESSKVKYTVSGNVITGSYNDILEVGEGLTVRCELPEGYFVYSSITGQSLIAIIPFIIPVIFLVVTILLWYIFGRDDRVVETVEFYPPQGFNSLEVGFLYKGKADNQDVTSLLVYLANKGYIKISEYEEKLLFTKHKGFKITKLKEYDGNNVNEKLFLDGLFQKRITLATLLQNNGIPAAPEETTEVTSSDLYDNFYRTMGQILSNINDKKNINKILERSASSKRVFIILMMIIAHCLIMIPPVLSYGESDLLTAIIVPGAAFFAVLFIMLRREPIATKIFVLIWGLFFGGAPWYFIVFPALKQEPLYAIGYTIGVACILGMAACLKYMPKRTPYGNEILGKIKGFRNFLETAEKERLESMVMQNPTYFYDILPYTYVLGISDMWIKKFETISVQAPSWYDNQTTFDMVSFGAFMHSTMASAQSALASSPSSDSSGGSSGGGSSGGGSGGGGGGSW